jgi:uncharacterized protein (TIGR02996 family)
LRGKEGPNVTQEIDLLRAVARAPDDDVRRVYSDWLEENDQLPRAEFVRGQIALEGLTEDSPQRRELAFRCRQLLDKHEQKWAGSLVRDCPERHWSRGFIEVIGCDPQTLERHREVAFDRTPTRRLILTGLGNRSDALTLIPSDHCLSALELIDCRFDLRGLKALAAALSSRFGGLAELSLLFNRLRDSAVPFLCQHPMFQGLSLLRLGCNPFSPGGRDRLCDHFGDRIDFAPDRYSGRLYAIGENYWYGWGHDHVQLLASGTTVFVFDHAGNLLRMEELPGDMVGSEDDERLLRLGYVPELVKVKRFRLADGTGIRDFPRLLASVWDGRHRPDEDLCDRLGDWLAYGNCMVDLGGDTFWFDREGLETRR